MGPNPEDLARAQDPTTSASELSSLAAVDPALWPAIAVHPNVYPDLLEWMHENGLDANAEAPTSTPMTPQARAAEASVALPISVTVMAWIKQRSRLLIWIGGGVVTAILAVVLVMTLVVAPQQRAAEAAAAAAAALKEAIAGFDDSATRCERMNAGLESAITVAEGQAAIDPGTLADPSLISSLRDEIDIAAGTERCDVPSMASDLADIDAQVVQVEADADGVEDATRKLEDAGSQVQRSVAEKEQVAAAAAAEAQRVAEAAQVAARTWTMQDPQGYSFTGTLAIGSITTSGTYASYALGAACGFDPSTDVAVPVTLTVTATTPGFDTNVSALVSLSESRSDQPHDVVIEAYYSEGPECKSPSYGSTILNGVVWQEPFTTGQSGSHQFVVIIRAWKTPATPAGDVAFLDAVYLSVNGGQNSGFGATEGKSLSLSNRVR